MIRLDIISDVACPWCYIGKAYLDRALEARPDHPFQIEWHPYQLNPELPPEGMDRIEFLKARFGSIDNIMKVHEPLLEHAEKAGVTFDLPAIERAANSFDAHRLIHWAGLEGRQTLMVSALFKAYWRDGRDIGNPDVLADIASEAGLDRALIARLLAGDSDRAELAQRMVHSRQKGVQAVPTFILADQYVLQGAQPTDMWTNIIDELAGRLDEA